MPASITFDTLVDALSDARDELQKLRAAVAAQAPAPMPTAAQASDQDDLIVAMAGSYQLPVVIVRAMVEQESSSMAVAMRYEPGFYVRYIHGQPLSFVPAGCSRDTEAICRAISWGPMQIMGETARCCGFRGWFGELLSCDAGIEWGCRYLRRLADKYLDDGGWPVVCRAYNGGPGNRHKLENTYPERILARIPGGQWPE